jgi:hypothetical protein
VPHGRARRAVLGSLALAAVGGPVLLARGSAGAGTTAAGTAAAAPRPLAPTLVWHPDPATDGLNAFEGIEDDRANSEPGVKHIYVQNGAYRVDMHAKQFDTSRDRQRNEVKGMRAGGNVLTMGNGDLWRITYDLFLPSTLHGTSHFTHIFQLKRPGSGSAPLVTMSLRRNGGREEIALRAFASGGDVASAPLAPLRDHWIGIDMTFRIGDKGAARFVITDGGRTVVDKTRTPVDIWLGDRIRTKWGIYRSLKSDRSDIIDTFLLMRNMKAYVGA